jgi:hypothetical protein
MMDFHEQVSHTVEYQPNNDLDQLLAKFLLKNREIALIITRFRKNYLRRDPFVPFKTSIKLPELIPRRTSTMEHKNMALHSTKVVHPAGEVDQANSD